MKNMGMLSFGVVGILAFSGGMIKFNPKQQWFPQEESTVNPQDQLKAGGAGGGPGEPYRDPITGAYTNPELPPDAPPGSIPPGSKDSRTGDAAICFDGTGYYPPGDTHIAATAYTIDGKYLNGDETKYIVVNRQDYGNIPLGTKAYVYNHNTGQGTWAIVGDRGPTQSRSEMSVATANAVGATIGRNSAGKMTNSVANHKITYHFY